MYVDFFPFLLNTYLCTCRVLWSAYFNFKNRTKKTIRLFSKVAIPCYVSTSHGRVPDAVHPRHSRGHMVLFHLWFYFAFPFWQMIMNITSCDYWPFVYLLWSFFIHFLNWTIRVIIPSYRSSLNIPNTHPSWDNIYHWEGQSVMSTTVYFFLVMPRI